MNGQPLPDCLTRIAIDDREEAERAMVATLVPGDRVSTEEQFRRIADAHASILRREAAAVLAAADVLPSREDGSEAARFAAMFAVDVCDANVDEYAATSLELRNRVLEGARVVTRSAWELYADRPGWAAHYRTLLAGAL